MISEPPLSSLTLTSIRLDVYKNSVTSFCGMYVLNDGSPSLVKSSGWMSGGPTAYRLLGRVTGLCLAVIFRSVFGTTLTDSSPVPHFANLLTS